MWVLSVSRTFSPKSRTRGPTRCTMSAYPFPRTCYLRMNGGLLPHPGDLHEWCGWLPEATDLDVGHSGRSCPRSCGLVWVVARQRSDAGRDAEDRIPLPSQGCCES